MNPAVTTWPATFTSPRPAPAVRPVPTAAIRPSAGRAWETILGFAPSEVEGATFLDFVWPDDIELTLAALDRAASTADLNGFENRYRHKDGTARWISWQTATEGDLVYAYGRDVTLKVEGVDGFSTEGVNSLSRICRDPADLAGGARIVGVVAELRRQVERDREPRLPALEQVAVARVRLLGRSKTRKQPHGPQLARVHRRLHAARVRK